MAGAPASSDTALNVVAWPQAPMHAVRMELEALSAAMAHQQAVLSQLVNGYSDLRRASEKESLLSAVRTVLEGPLQRLEASLREDVARDSRRLDEVVGGLHELTAAQRAHQESVTAGREELRTELHDALGEERRELSQEFAATTAVVGETKGLLSELKESVVRLQASAEAERERDRQVIGQWLYAMAESIGRVVSEAVTQAVADGEERMFDRLEAGVRQFRHSLKDMEEVSARQRMEAERVEGERLHVLHACLAELTDALRGTHALAAAQREETDLLDGAMSTLQESLVDLRASVAKQHVEVREDLARQRRSTGELIKRQLRPITESLPELVADAARGVRRKR